MKISGNTKGFIALITMVILIATAVIAFSMVMMSQLNNAASRNYSYKIMSFNASDGVMTLLAQDLIDHQENNYNFTSLDHTDIGNTVVVGDYLHGSDGSDTVRGDGGSFGGNTQTSDNFHFAYCPVTGDFQASVQIKSIQNTSSYAKAALHIRQSTDANAAFFHIAATYGQGYFVQYRTSTNAPVQQTILGSGSVPVWFRITRSNNTFTAEKSSNGSSWTTVGTQNITMSNPVVAGLGVASYASGTLCTAIFSNLTGLAGATTSGTVVFEDNQLPVDYTITKTGANTFLLTTDAYFLTSNGDKIKRFSSRLTQNLRREEAAQWTQTQNDSVYIPVTLYDFRSDLTCPEFNIRGTISLKAGTNVTANFIQTTLDTDRKPVLKMDNSFRTAFLKVFNPAWYTITPTARINAINNADSAQKVACYINNGYNFTWDFCDSLHTWFRPWGDSIGKSGTYTFDTATGRWNGLKRRPSITGSPTSDEGWVTAHWDSTRPFANIVFYDTLKFRELPAPDTGMYRFGDSVHAWGPDAKYFVLGCGYSDGTNDFRTDEWRFMPLQNRGFKYDAVRYIDPGDNSCCDKQNFGFTMEIHHKFAYKSGQIFKFRGDDDVWVFLNNKKVIDLGGIHLPCSMSVNLDTCGLVAGNVYNFDMFYCERNVEASNILITTNLMFLSPSSPARRNWRRDYGNLD